MCNFLVLARSYFLDGLPGLEPTKARRNILPIPTMVSRLRGISLDPPTMDGMFTSISYTQLYVPITCLNLYDS